LIFGVVRAWTASIDAEALAVCGETLSSIADGARVTEEEAFRRLYAFAAECTDAAALPDIVMVAHKGTMELRLNRAAESRYEIVAPFNQRIIDIVGLCESHLLRRGVRPPRSHAGTSALTLDFAREYVGLPPEPRPHTGLAGADGAGEVFYRLTFGRPWLADFAAHQLPPYL
jgi:hypothetical protein